MGKIISIAINKGGCGKTTTAQSIAVCLADQGYSCLLVDLDPSGNLTFSSNIAESVYTVYELIKGQCSYDEVIQISKNYDIIPGGMALSSADFELHETDVRDILKPLKDRYDYIIIDTPSNLGRLTRNSLVAADYIIIPVESSFYAFQGLETMYEVINSIRLHLNQDLKVLGLLLFRYKSKTSINRFLRLLVSKSATERNLSIFNTFIRESSEISEAQGLQNSIIECYPKSKLSLDYQSFTDEILEKIHGNRIRKII